MYPKLAADSLRVQKDKFENLEANLIIKKHLKCSNQDMREESLSCMEGYDVQEGAGKLRCSLDKRA